MNPINFTKTKRLSRDNGYNRPKKTYQDTLTADEIKDKLEGYKKITDVRNITIGTHVRYFTTDKNTKKKVFRLGGFVSKFGDDNKYLVLSNGSISWSVQNDKDTILWAKMGQKEFKETIETEIQEEHNNKQEDPQMKEKYKKLKEKNDYIVKLLEEQQKENEKLSKKIKNIENLTKKNKN